MAFDWTTDLQCIITSYNYQSYMVGETTVNDLMQAYLLRPKTRRVTAHCFRTGFSTLTSKTGPIVGWPIGLASPSVIYMAHRNGITENDELEINLYHVGAVLGEGGAYSQGATDMTGVVAHEPYKTVSIANVSGHDSDQKPFTIVPWTPEKMLVVDTVTENADEWRIHEVSLIDGSVNTHTGIFEASGQYITEDKHCYITRSGHLMVPTMHFFSTGRSAYLIDTSDWSIVTSGLTQSGMVIELKDGDFYNDSAGFINTDKLYDNTLTAIGDSVPSTATYRYYPCRVYNENALIIQSDGGTSGQYKPYKHTFGTFPSVTSVDLGCSTTAQRLGMWYAPIDETYGLAREGDTGTFRITALADGSAHPSISTWFETDDDLPVSGSASTIGQWGKGYNSSHNAWVMTNTMGDKITLGYGIENGNFTVSYPISLVGVADNGGDPAPLLRATRLTVSDTVSATPTIQLNSVYIPTVNDLTGGTGISVSASGATVTIASSINSNRYIPAAGTTGQVLKKLSNADYNVGWANESGGGGSSGGNIAGAYDIEQGGNPIYSDLGLSDEFDTGTLNSAWTVVTGSAGTVDLLGTVVDTVYDLSSRDKGMLVQCDNAAASYFEMRAAVIDVDEQLIVSMTHTPPGLSANNGGWSGISVNSSATNHLSGTYARLCVDGSDNTNVTLYTGSEQARVPFGTLPGSRVYWRVVRDSTKFWFFVSTDGISWCPVGSNAVTGAAYVWVLAGANLAYSRNSSPDPIVSINWVRHVAYTGVDPW